MYRCEIARQAGTGVRACVRAFVRACVLAHLRARDRRPLGEAALQSVYLLRWSRDPRCDASSSGSSGAALCAHSNVMLSRARSSPPRENAAVCPRGPDLSSPSPPSHPLPELRTARGSLSLARARSLLLPPPLARSAAKIARPTPRRATTFG